MNEKSRIDRREFLRLAGIAGVLLAGTGVGCQPQQATQTSPPTSAPAGAATSPLKLSGGLVMAVNDFGAEIFDPILGSPAMKGHASLMYDFLVGVDRKGRELDPTTGIAKRWEESADGLAWTFWLRDGIKFHNGEDLTADDVKFSIERNISEKSLSANGALLRGNFLSINVEDPYRLKMTLKKRNWTLPLRFSSLPDATEGLVYPKNYVTEKGDKYFSEHPIGSGPYRFDGWLSGNSISYKAVGNWLVARPKYDEITFKLIPEESTRIAMLETGQADIMVGLSPVKVKSLEDKFRILVKEGDTNWAVTMMQKWTAGNPLGNEKVREALTLALNVNEMSNQLLGGLGKVTGSYPIRSSSPGYQAVKPAPYDPEKAKRLLKEAGYAPGQLTLNVYVNARPTGQGLESPLSEAFAGYWEVVGVKSKLIKTDYAPFRSMWEGKTLEDPAVRTYPDFPNYPYLFSTFSSSNGRFTSNKDPQLDRLVETAGTAPDEKAYWVAAAAVEQYLREHFLFISLFELGVIVTTTKALPAWDLGLQAYDYNLRDLYW